MVGKRQSNFDLIPCKKKNKTKKKFKKPYRLWENQYLKPINRMNWGGEKKKKKKLSTRPAPYTSCHPTKKPS